MQWAKQGASGLFKGYWVRKGTSHAAWINARGFMGQYLSTLPQATNAVWLPWNTAYIAAYEQSKRSVTGMLQLQDQSGLPLWALTACSMGAG